MVFINLLCIKQLKRTLGCTVNIYINILSTIEPAITLTDSTNGGRVLLTSGERCTETPDFITWLWHCLYWMDDLRGVARKHFTPMTSIVTWKKCTSQKCSWLHINHYSFPAHWKKTHDWIQLDGYIWYLKKIKKITGLGLVSNEWPLRKW